MSSCFQSTLLFHEVVEVIENMAPSLLGRGAFNRLVLLLSCSVYLIYLKFKVQTGGAIWGTYTQLIITKPSYFALAIEGILCGGILLPICSHFRHPLEGRFIHKHGCSCEDLLLTYLKSGKFQHFHHCGYLNAHARRFKGPVQLINQTQYLLIFTSLVGVKLVL